MNFVPRVAELPNEANLHVLAGWGVGRYSWGMTDNIKKVPTLKEMYPDASDEQLADVAMRIDRHIRLVMEIYDRIMANPEEYAELRAILTKSRGQV